MNECNILQIVQSSGGRPRGTPQTARQRLRQVRSPSRHMHAPTARQRLRQAQSERSKHCASTSNTGSTARGGPCGWRCPTTAARAAAGGSTTAVRPTGWARLRCWCTRSRRTAPRRIRTRRAALGCRTERCRSCSGGTLCASPAHPRQHIVSGACREVRHDYV